MPSGPMEQRHALGRAPRSQTAAHWKSSGSPSEMRRARSAASGTTLRLEHAEDEHGQADHEARQRPGDADVEERAAVGDRAADADEGPERPHQR